MAPKRPLETTHPSRLTQVPSEPRPKKQKPNTLAPTSFKKAHPLNPLKSRVRSLRRLLENPTASLPADVRVEKERALQTAQRELDEESQAKVRSEMIGRWHRVRFFERQKATKRLKRARKEGREEEAREAETDVMYAMYFPLEVPYVPLYPVKRGEDGEAGVEVERQGDKEMWGRVRECMREGTLEALKHGRLEPERARTRKSEVEAVVEKKRPKEKVVKVKTPVQGSRR